jgi:hypothetical protein
LKKPTTKTTLRFSGAGANYQKAKDALVYALNRRPDEEGHVAFNRAEAALHEMFEGDQWTVSKLRKVAKESLARTAPKGEPESKLKSPVDDLPSLDQL